MAASAKSIGRRKKAAVKSRFGQRHWLRVTTARSSRCASAAGHRHTTLPRAPSQRRTPHVPRASPSRRVAKALFRRALSHIARGAPQDAKQDAAAALAEAPSDASISLLSRALDASLAAPPFNARLELPRLRALECTGFSELYAVGHDPPHDAFRAMMRREPYPEILCKPLLIYEPEHLAAQLQNPARPVERPGTLAGYFGGVGDARAARACHPDGSGRAARLSTQDTARGLWRRGVALAQAVGPARAALSERHQSRFGWCSDCSCCSRCLIASRASPI